MTLSIKASDLLEFLEHASPDSTIRFVMAGNESLEFDVREQWHDGTTSTISLEPIDWEIERWNKSK